MERIERPAKCPACGHVPHQTTCRCSIGWLRIWLSGLEYCMCSYWDARWGNQALVPGSSPEAPHP